MEDYFKGITTKEGARRRFVALAKKLHPDVGPQADSEAMVRLSEQYRMILSQLDRSKQRTDSKRSYSDVAVAMPLYTAGQNFDDDNQEETPQLSVVQDENLREIIDDGIDLAERVGKMLLKRAFTSLRKSLRS